MTKYYIPIRCPNCGETHHTLVDNPIGDAADRKRYTFSLTVKWVECNICGEIFPLPRDVKEIKET
jgi:ribosomal protein S27E